MGAGAVHEYVVYGILAALAANGALLVAVLRTARGVQQLLSDLVLAADGDSRKYRHALRNLAAALGMQRSLEDALLDADALEAPHDHDGMFATTTREET